jgi:hypothetical protein
VADKPDVERARELRERCKREDVITMDDVLWEWVAEQFRAVRLEEAKWWHKRDHLAGSALGVARLAELEASK